MRNGSIRAVIVPALVSGFLASLPAHAATELFAAQLSGDQEVPPIFTAATGVFNMEIQTGGTSPVVTFTLSFADLSAPLAASHLHFAPTGVAGGVTIFLCGGGGQPACPAATSGTITGTLTSANVVGPAAQGIAAGNLDAVLEIIREGNTYANMHDATFPGGEARGQVVHGTRP